ncbi:hypothetical protein DICVIV_13517 [Dictyocaulus viviparus]|uniref:Uncharacterized protein n=1 Tax=Dictyocaulus viviparus TaxID=29172 RepID=A0A0D8X7K9_DICVI|nr:hypothetical protein DICVIV_13517 [Dictyocaulus viviparus]
MVSVKQVQDGLSMIYDIVVRLTPSAGLFSAVIRSNASGLIMASGFTRIDHFNSQGGCLFGSPLEPLCHCENTTVP